jgi:putative mRNA 3-end processing factor
VLLTHGHTGPLVRTLRQAGIDADTLRTEYGGEDGSDEPGAVGDSSLEMQDDAGARS